MTGAVKGDVAMPVCRKFTRSLTSRLLLACSLMACSGAACVGGEDDGSCTTILVLTARGTITGSDGTSVVADSVQLFADEAGRPGERLEECAGDMEGGYRCFGGRGRPLILRVTLGSAIRDVAFESRLTSDGCHPITETIDVMIDGP